MTGDPKISLQAISGIRDSSTMQLLAEVSGVTILLLVYSGSTHNFMREGLIPRLGLEKTKAASLCGKWGTCT